ncbi:MAG: uncharacterized membrane-anchored protein YhcB (DUF1043 family) [Oleiphilaceae bacterium]
MSEFIIQILSGAGLFFLGIMLGVVFHRSFQGETSKNKRLEQKLAELQDTHSRYQAEVSEHFMDTAKAVQTLNKSYREVHTQLAKGASKLCSDDHSDQFLSINLSPDNTNTQTEDNQHYAPPMDYAPKDTPDAEGTLSERYGLEDSEVPDNNINEPSSQEPQKDSNEDYEQPLAEKENTSGEPEQNRTR